MFHMKILEWTGKYNKKKFSNLENYYDNNAILFAPGSDVVQGKRNIKEFYSRIEMIFLLEI